MPQEWKDVVRGWNTTHNIWLPPAQPEAVYLLPDEAQYGRDFKAAIDADPKLRHSVCTVISAMTGRPDHAETRAGAQLRWRATAICSAFTIDLEARNRVAQYFDSLAPFASSHLQRVMQMAPRPKDMDERWFSAAGLYAPPPAAPEAWKSGAVSGRDYERDVTASFTADPILSAYVCFEALREPQAGQAAPEPLRASLKRVCKNIPAESMLRAAREYNAAEDASWIAGLVGTYEKEAVALSAAQRKEDAARLREQLKTMQHSFHTRFETPLRALVLDPADWRNAMLIIKYAGEGIRNANATTPQQLVASVQTVVDQRAAGNVDWKRARRNLLALRGEFELARQAAAALPKGGRDQVFAALLDRLRGDRRSFDALMARCPAADSEFVIAYGKPEQPVRFCEALMSELAGGLIAQLGKSAPAALTDIAVETNRTAPQDVKQIAGTSSQDRTESPLSREVAGVTAMINAEVERAAKMSRLEREAAAERLIAESEVFIVDFQKAVRVLALVPAREVGAASAFYAARYRGGSSEFDLPGTARKVVLRAIEQRAAAGGPEAAEWKRARRNALFFSGDYTAARDAAHEIVRRYPDARYEMRDKVMAAVLDRLLGNAKPYEDVVAACPSTDEFDPEISSDRSFYCRYNAWWNARRVIGIRGEKTPPVINEVLAEMMRTYPDYSRETCITLCTLRDLVQSDPQFAQREIERVLADKKSPPMLVRDAIYSRFEIAEKQKNWPEALQWYDAFIRTLDKDLLGFPRDGWKVVARVPRLRETYVPPQLIAALQGRAETAILSGDAEEMRKSIERIVPYAIAEQNARLVQELLLNLVDRRLNAGDPDKLRRVLGYLAGQDLPDDLSQRLNHYREKMKLGPNDLAAAESPWETRPEFDRPPRPEPLKPVA
jgi:hypothetical protein